MRLRLGINTCFAVKRWPRPEDWAPIVADRLGLGLVQHSLDLVDLATADAGLERQATALRAAAAANRLAVTSTFTVSRPIPRTCSWILIPTGAPPPRHGSGGRCASRRSSGRLQPVVTSAP